MVLTASGCLSLRHGVYSNPSAVTSLSLTSSGSGDIAEGKAWAISQIAVVFVCSAVTMAMSPCLTEVEKCLTGRTD